MPEPETDSDDLLDQGERAASESDEEVVQSEQAKLRAFIRDLSGDDIKTGNWFTKLVSHALSQYTKKVDWEYFQRKYDGVPADAIVEQRIAMAARYAALEGGLSASAYTGAIAATIGSLGGASPATVPAAVGTVMVDVAFTTQLQLRLAYDISVLYRVPLDVNDPDDLWKLIRIAFTIKSGEVAREGVIKVVPAFIRPLIRRFYSRAVLSFGRSLPVVGRFLLQRNMIKIGIPLVGVPLSVVLNRYSTLLVGRHARAVFRNDARIIELAGRLADRTDHPETLLWVAWMVVTANKKTSDDGAQLMRHLIVAVRDRHKVDDHGLRDLIDLDREEVWRRLDQASGDLSDLVEAAWLIARADGEASPREKAVLDELSRRCGVPGSEDPVPGDGSSPP